MTTTIPTPYDARVEQLTPSLSPPPLRSWRRWRLWRPSPRNTLGRDLGIQEVTAPTYPISSVQS